MRVLRSLDEMQREISTTHDHALAKRLRQQVEFMSDDQSEESLTVFIVEPGDTLQEVDAAMNHQLLVNDYSGRRYTEDGFIPCFETLVEFATFYEMFFVEGGGEVGTSVVIPKMPEVDPELLALCIRHAEPAQEGV